MIDSKNNNVLYIDDNEKFGTNIVHGFLEKNYEIHWAKNRKDASLKFKQYKPNILICDIMLANKNIIRLIETLKKENDNLYVIVITSNFEKDNLIKCLNLGISHYIEKNEQAMEKVFTFFDEDKINIDDESERYVLGEGFVYNKKTKELYNKNSVVKLNNQERLLIEILLKNKNNYVQYNQIQTVISKNNEVSIDSLRTLVRNIRQKTYTDIIKNLSGYGYKLTLFSGELFYQTELNEENIIKNTRVLIVEDSLSLQHSLSSELKSFNFDCDNASTFSEAQKKLEHSVYDYILLDLHLPDKDGIDLLNSIKNITTSKLIVLTEDTDVHLKEYLYLQGILDYVEKSNSTNYLAYTLYKTILNIEHNDSLNNIIVVDPSSLVCEQISNLLTPRNYNLTFCHNMNEATTLLKNINCDLIIIDLELLGDSSFESLNQIKNCHKELPIMLLSSYKKSSTNRDAFKNGVSEILTKPLLTEEFILKVDFWIDYHRKVFQLKSQQQLLNEYKSIVDKASIVSKTDLEGKITYVNSTFCDISGYSESELLGEPHCIVRHEEMESEIFSELWDCIKVKKQIWHGKIKNRRKDGRTYYVDSYVMPILNVDGEIIEYMALRNDITKKEFYN